MIIEETAQKTADAILIAFETRKSLRNKVLVRIQRGLPIFEHFQLEQWMHIVALSGEDSTFLNEENYPIFSKKVSLCVIKKLHPHT